MWVFRDVRRDLELFIIWIYMEVVGEVDKKNLVGLVGLKFVW